MAGRSLVKTGFMVGLGETENEVERLLYCLRDEAGAHAVTIGQYLRPSKQHLAVVKYVPPEEFDRYRSYGESLGLCVQAGPFVRSSYLAEEGFHRASLADEFPHQFLEHGVVEIDVLVRGLR